MTEPIGVTEHRLTNTVSDDRHDRLVRDDAVLLLIDFQVGPLWELDAQGLRRDVVALARVAGIVGVPSILTALAMDDWGPIIPSLTHATPDAVTIERSVLDLWSIPRLRQAIEATGRTQLVIAGIATEICVVRAALDARRAGYRVNAVLDASGHFNARAAADAVFRMRAAGVVITSSAAVLIELLRSSPESEASDLLAIGLRHTLPRPPATSIGRRTRTLHPSGVVP
jgi:isochorismate hydrolase